MISSRAIYEITGQASDEIAKRLTSDDITLSELDEMMAQYVRYSILTSYSVNT